MVAEIRQVEQDGHDERTPPKPALYTLEEVGVRMGMSYPAVWGHYSGGSLPWEPLRIGRKVFFRRSEVDRDLGIENGEG